MSFLGIQQKEKVTKQAVHVAKLTEYAGFSTFDRLTLNNTNYLLGEFAGSIYSGRLSHGGYQK